MSHICQSSSFSSFKTFEEKARVKYTAISIINFVEQVSTLRDKAEWWSGSSLEFAYHCFVVVVVVFFFFAREA